MQETPSVLLQFLPLLVLLAIGLTIFFVANRNKTDIIPGLSSSDACPLCKGIIDKKKPTALYGHIICRKCYFSFANRRQLAFFIDCIAFRVIGALFAILIVSAMATSAPSKETIESMDALLSLLMLVVFFCKDGISGQSPGKALCGIKVIDEVTGQPAGFSTSFKRNLPLIIPFMPLFVAFQLCSGHRIGDGWSTSKVIWKKYANNPIFSPKNSA